MVVSQGLDSEVRSDFRKRLYDSYRSGQPSTIPLDDRAAREPFILDLIKKHFPSDRDAVLLDLGCGSGTLLYYLKQAGYRNISGVDVSAEQIAKARSFKIDEARQGDLFEAINGAGDCAFDLVATLDVVEHLTRAESLDLAIQIHRALKPDGKWVIHVPNAEGLFGSRIRYADWTHEQAFTKESLEQMAKVVGFTQINCFEDAPIVHGFKSGVRWLAWKIIRIMLRACWMAETGSIGQDCIFTQNMLAVAVKEDR